MFKSLVWLDPEKIPSQAGFESGSFRSRGGRLTTRPTRRCVRWEGNQPKVAGNWRLICINCKEVLRPKTQHRKEWILAETLKKIEEGKRKKKKKKRQKSTTVVYEQEKPGPMKNILVLIREPRISQRQTKWMHKNASKRNKSDGSPRTLLSRMCSGRSFINMKKAEVRDYCLVEHLSVWHQQQTSCRLHKRTVICTRLFWIAKPKP